MGAVLLLGFLIGMKHALEADHVAAVASLAARGRSLPEALRMGAAWGLGHTLTLFTVGAVVLSIDTVLPERLAVMLELGVGVMLLWLGADVVFRLIRDRIHFHLHRHDDGTVHFHAHSHAGHGVHDTASHRHEHRPRLPLRALMVGCMHGMAGSAALILLTLGEIDSLPLALGYMALFGIGSMLGMAALSLAIALPLRRAARSLTWAHNALHGCIGLGTIGLGAWIVYRLAHDGVAAAG